MTKTNIKGLPPDRNYFTAVGYTQRYPWVEVGRTRRTVILAKVDVKPDPDWEAKRHFTPGGFCGHCDNQNEQTWLFDRINLGRVLRVRATKIGWAHRGFRFVEGEATEFYDYNF